jgi:hypothetical protein
VDKFYFTDNQPIGAFYSNPPLTAKRSLTALKANKPLQNSGLFVY